MTTRPRTLIDGRVCFDVRYWDAYGRQTCRRGFSDPDRAAAFEAVVARAIRRWPLEPLLERTGVDLAELTDIAARVGLDRRSLHFARRDGLTDVQADALAIHTGWHPLEVWGWAWVEAGLAFGPLDRHNPDPLPAPSDGEGVAA